MGRPLKTSADYFSLLVNYHKTREIQGLRAEMGADGYGNYLILLGMIAASENMELPFGERDKGYVRMELGISKKKFEKLIQVLTDFKLIFIENETIFSEITQNLKKTLSEKRSKDRQKYEFSPPKSTQSIVEYNKEKKSVLEDSDSTSIPHEYFFKYFEENDKEKLIADFTSLYPGTPNISTELNKLINKFNVVKKRPHYESGYSDFFSHLKNYLSSELTANRPSTNSQPKRKWLTETTNSETTPPYYRKLN